MRSVQIVASRLEREREAGGPAASGESAANASSTVAGDATCECGWLGGAACAAPSTGKPGLSDAGLPSIA
jgi:hypothetical protein